ncbi:16S rRNA (guanine(527)-N(7))-methyltransferase RsmG [endosymbiont of Acanthamoeba sp. UWC8]|uniref:16S rRNA (guanine(527)-N(7))-methyltransferase RsmG n=1 Tax=endosymbiont of Acanthamoeba sp. UWC8 TaxID=86106 RepID=UPI000695B984|nr:16S rRNA (guanine(527)-N(7))-methyltransferase RsmG [endosymbiont of Acanthamoeba sp. UWC8]
MVDLLFELMEENFPNVPRETILQLNTYLNLVEKWNTKINLVSKNCPREELVTRHLLDSLQLIEYIDSPNALVTDLGSGGGFPGLVLAIAGNNCNLVEINTKKTIFLKEVVLKLNLKSKVLNQDFKTLTGYKSDYIVSRAVSNINYLLNASKAIVSEKTVCLFLKSKNQIKEIKELENSWSFDLAIHENKFDNDGVIIEIKKLKEWAK